MVAMRVLYDAMLHAGCRTVRLVLKEKGLEFELQTVRPWERPDELIDLNPAADVPVLVEQGGRVLCDSRAICEYLDEAYPDRPIIGFDPDSRAETRRLVAWFADKFHDEVWRNLVWEKAVKRWSGRGEPDSAAIRAGLHNVRHHLDYIGFLSERRKWLAGESFTLADMAAAAELSCVDYLGNVPWDDFPAAKDWYARVKSRPSFRPLLADQVAGMRPPAHYADLDF